MTTSGQPVRRTRVVGYVRVSKAREEMISPAIQEEAIRAACARKPGYEVVKVIADLDKTGRNFIREGVREAIRLVEAGQADVVMVWRWSRFGRNSHDFRVNMARVEVAGGRLESAVEDVDATTSTGRLTRGMMIELAEFESERYSEGWKDALATRAANGLPGNGRIRFGYSYHRCSETCGSDCRTGYTPDPATGPVLASMYRRYLDGASLPSLRDWCTATGQPRERGGRWDTSAVTDVLDSGFGAALLHSGGRTVAGRFTPHAWAPGAHEAVITSEEWHAYLARRQSLRTVPSSHKAPTYTLTGLVVCGQCGGGMFAASSRRGPGYLYRCSAMQNSGRCPGVWRVRSALEAAVLDALDPYAERLEAAARLALAQPRPRPAPPEAVSPTKQAQADLRVASEGLDRLAKSVASGVLSDDEVATEASRLRALRSSAQTRLHDLGSPSSPAPTPAVRVRRLREQWGELPVPTRRAIVAELFERVIVHADKRIEVVARFQ